MNGETQMLLEEYSHRREGKLLRLMCELEEKNLVENLIKRFPELAESIKKNLYAAALIRNSVTGERFDMKAGSTEYQLREETNTIAEAACRRSSYQNGVYTKAELAELGKIKERCIELAKRRERIEQEAKHFSANIHIGLYDTEELGQHVFGSINGIYEEGGDLGDKKYGKIYIQCSWKDLCKEIVLHQHGPIELDTNPYNPKVPIAISYKIGEILGLNMRLNPNELTVGEKLVYGPHIRFYRS